MHFNFKQNRVKKCENAFFKEIKQNGGSLKMKDLFLDAF